MTQAKFVASWLDYNYVQINLKEKKTSISQIKVD